jgi:hypothetical protein
MCAFSRILAASLSGAVTMAPLSGGSDAGSSTIKVFSAVVSSCPDQYVQLQVHDCSKRIAPAVNWCPGIEQGALLLGIL